MPSPTDPPDSLRCFDCGQRYAHLGRGVHPGRCPDCGSRGVSPAGRLRVAGDPTGVGSAGLRVAAIDATDRRFEYWISALGDGVRAQLVGIQVADTVVDPPHDAWPGGIGELVPDALEETVRRVDLQLTAPAPVVG